jgi:hypothetical protein
VALRGRVAGRGGIVEREHVAGRGSIARSPVLPSGKTRGARLFFNGLSCCDMLQEMILKTTENTLMRSTEKDDSACV